MQKMGKSEIGKWEIEKWGTRRKIREMDKWRKIRDMGKGKRNWEFEKLDKWGNIEN